MAKHGKTQDQARRAVPSGPQGQPVIGVTYEVIVKRGREFKIGEGSESIGAQIDHLIMESANQGERLGELTVDLHPLFAWFEKEQGWVAADADFRSSKPEPLGDRLAEVD